MKSLPIVVFTLLFSTHIIAQDSCTYEETFHWAQELLRVNYSGYKDKVNPENQQEFAAFTAEYQQKIAAAESDTSC